MQEAVSRVDYSLARRAVLHQVQGGRVSRYEVCDAHPDLLRAARYCGEATAESCPVCDRGPLVLVSYAFSEDFSKQEDGKVWASGDLAGLAKLSEARLYTVEVCTDCSWNHLRSQLAMRGGRARHRRRASK